MRHQSEAFIDSDIFAEHLSCKMEMSFLTECIQAFDCCYTSVINVAEVLSACSSPEERDVAKRAFYCVGLLGIPYRYADKLSEMIKFIMAQKKGTLRDALIMMMCSETKLPLITFDAARYGELSDEFGVKLFGKDDVKKKQNSVIK